MTGRSVLLAEAKTYPDPSIRNSFRSFEQKHSEAAGWTIEIDMAPNLESFGEFELTIIAHNASNQSDWFHEHSIPINDKLTVARLYLFYAGKYAMKRKWVIEQCNKVLHDTRWLLVRPTI